MTTRRGTRRTLLGHPAQDRDGRLSISYVVKVPDDHYWTGGNRYPPLPTADQQIHRRAMVASLFRRIPLDPDSQ